MKSKTFGIAAVLILVTLVAVWLLASRDDTMTSGGLSSQTPLNSGERPPLYWVAPMDANYRRDEPGLSPMGMPLIPVYESSDTISVSASIQQNLGVRTAVTVREDFAPTIQAVGYTVWDASTIQMLHTRAEGWLEAFNLASVGDRVNVGDILYELFSPNLVSAQREFLTALESTNSQLTAVARDRLIALGFSPEQVYTLENTTRVSNHLTVYSVRDAIVTDIGVRAGNYVTPATTLATFASLDSIWVEAQVFESFAGWIEPGLPATLSFVAFPEQVWNTRIAYVYPTLDAITRSLRLRLVLQNADGRLRPNMFVNVAISGTPKRGVLTVPREAVIRAGAGDRVIVALGEGQFRPAVVQTGIASGTRIEIINGLNEGDRVVTSGQFLLDSEANGEQAFARLTTMNGNGAVSGAMNVDSTSDAQVNRNTDPGDPLTAKEVAGIYETTGEITQIIPGTAVIISHQPVPALSWPAMEMGFQMTPQINIENIGVGDVVVFAFEAAPQGGYQLVRITPREGAQ